MMAAAFSRKADEGFLDAVWNQKKASCGSEDLEGTLRCHHPRGVDKMGSCYDFTVSEWIIQLQPIDLSSDHVASAKASASIDHH
jgi:hypothetical protein